MKECIVGVDIGGMSIKCIIIDKQGNSLIEGRIETGVEDGVEQVCENIVALVRKLLWELKEYLPLGVGIGCPGLIDSKEGVVVYAANLKFENVHLADYVEHALVLPVKITNDANAAALGEAVFGAGKQYEDSVTVTLGTGVGGGIVVGGKLFEGYRSAGAELGHMVIVKDGNQCSCGTKGCFEAYSSATALKKATKEAMEAHPESRMWERYTLDTVSGKTAFEYEAIDPAAKEVVDSYISHLAVGLANIANIFRPQAILIGGGISGEGEHLLAPLREEFSKLLFGGSSYAPVKIEKASLGNRAGALGAAALILD